MSLLDENAGPAGAGSLGDEARRLRDAGVPVADIQARLGVTKHALTSWLARRPLAKDELRRRAVELRTGGWSVNDIAIELAVARSTAWRWVKHLPLDRSSERAREKAEHSKLMTDARWARHRAERDRERERVMTESEALAGELSERDVLLIGAAIYWCEGSKSKPWRRSERLKFTNSDPGLVGLFLRFLRACGVSTSTIAFRVSIHETADVAAATAWWASHIGVPPAAFLRPTIKRHRPSTNRRNNADGYHGCLVVEVARSRRIYWRIEGLMAGIVRATIVISARRCQPLRCASNHSAVV